MSTRREWSGHVFIATSVDGYIALPDGNLEWLTDPPVGTKHVPAIRPNSAPVDYDEFTAEVTHLVMGRGTYDKVITFGSWPYNSFRTIVISTSLDAAADDRIRVVTSLEQAVTLLDEENAGKVYLDGGKVITAFLAASLIDELTISRAPIILGAGLNLFHALPHPIRLVHLGTSTTDTGMTNTRYRIISNRDS